MGQEVPCHCAGNANPLMHAIVWQMDSSLFDEQAGGSPNLAVMHNVHKREDNDQVSGNR